MAKCKDGDNVLNFLLFKMVKDVLVNIIEGEGDIEKGKGSIF